MSYDPQKAHYLVVTWIIVKDWKYLIAKRSSDEKAFPNLWTVPGGKLEMDEYATRPKDTGDHWYNIFENVLRREVLEETSLEVKNIWYVTSIAYMRPDNIPTIIISLYADYAWWEVSLCPALTDYAWVTLEESKNYELIEWIYEEIEMLDKKLKWEELWVWKKI
ncbi:MAG: hypothetical protein ACD_2C00115G0001 [uncultured bacterium (gcode 4)]|uniref:Nudix hydrolase domain-containing protein n=1 Tax=uncultured bacterium (gcode 4) TaxID=1234023 RepID=K2H1K4_9BACT|nr:MAG: hypothetical protein ACD_2C00115G0001 [uncultured bacterium (gcode 4)]